MNAEQAFQKKDFSFLQSQLVYVSYGFSLILFVIYLVSIFFHVSFEILNIVSLGVFLSATVGFLIEFSILILKVARHSLSTLVGKLCLALIALISNILANSYSKSLIHYIVHYDPSYFKQFIFLSNFFFTFLITVSVVIILLFLYESIRYFYWMIVALSSMAFFGFIVLFRPEFNDFSAFLIRGIKIVFRNLGHYFTI